MGGYVALALARLAGERSRGLFLAGARVGADDADRQAARNAAIETLREQGIDAWAPSAPAPPPPERTVEELIRSTEALRDRRDSTEFVRDYERPLWMVVGSEDPFLPRDEAREIVESAPNGRLEVLDGAGHFTNVERRNRFNARPRRFDQPHRVTSVKRREPLRHSSRGLTRESRTLSRSFPVPLGTWPLPVGLPRR